MHKMKKEDVEKLFNRMKRLAKDFEAKGGSGATWNYIFPDGIETKYIINNIKSPEEIEDKVESLLLWVWSCKDYLKKYSITYGKEDKWIENIVNNNREICICADIANALKHGGTNKSRSGLFPKLGDVAYSMPQTTLGKITLSANDIEIDIADPSGVDITIPVMDQNGNQVGDIFECIDATIKAWEKIIDEIENKGKKAVKHFKQCSK